MNIRMGNQEIGVVSIRSRRSLCVAVGVVGVGVSVFGVASLWFLWLMCWCIMLLNVAWHCKIAKDM